MNDTPSPGQRSFEKIAWSRWFARVWLDYSFLGITFGFVLSVVAPDSVLLTDDFTFVFFLLIAALWIPIEAGFVAKWGRTPGKWLLGLRVTKLDGSRLLYSEALGRAAAVWMTGCGFLIPLVFLFTMNAQYKRVRVGQPASWDEKRGFIVEAAPLTDGQLRGLVLTVVALLVLRVMSAAS